MMGKIKAHSMEIPSVMRARSKMPAHKRYIIKIELQLYNESTKARFTLSAADIMAIVITKHILYI